MAAGSGPSLGVLEHCRPKAHAFRGAQAMSASAAEVDLGYEKQEGLKPRSTQMISDDFDKKTCQEHMSG